MLELEMQKFVAAMGLSVSQQAEVQEQLNSLQKTGGVIPSQVLDFANAWAGVAAGAGIKPGFVLKFSAACVMVGMRREAGPITYDLLLIAPPETPDYEAWLNEVVRLSAAGEGQSFLPASAVRSQVRRFIHELRFAARLLSS